MLAEPPDYSCLACNKLQKSFKNTANSDKVGPGTLTPWQILEVITVCLACAWLETLWGNGKMAFFEQKMLHQVGSRFIKKC